MSKIKVNSPIVELDGDEMTRIIWEMIKEKLVFPYLDVDLKYYDLHLSNRDKTDDQVTVDAANAIAKHGVGVKCATITANPGRVEEYKLKKAWPSPNATIRGILDGTVFRKPIMFPQIKPAVRTWTKPITIGRHAYGDIYKARELKVPAGSTAAITVTDGSGYSSSHTIFEFPSDGLVMGMYNTIPSIQSFARASISYALSEGIDLWFGAKDTISKTYHQSFREIFEQEISSKKAEFESRGISYRYMLIDDAIAQLMKHEGGMLLSLMNYDGDVFSDMIAGGFGSLGLMTSVLVSPNGCFEYEAAHGTVTRHYYRYKNSEKTSTNSIASIYAWSGAIRKRGELDGQPEVSAFGDRLEKAVTDTVVSGIMTKDMAIMAGVVPESAATTDGFIDAVASKLL